MVRGTKSTTAFVEFVDMTSAIMVHDSLQVGWLVAWQRRRCVWGWAVKCKCSEPGAVWWSP